MNNEQFEDLRDRLMRIETIFEQRVKPGEGAACAEHSVRIDRVVMEVNGIHSEVGRLRQRVAGYAGGLAVVVFFASAAASVAAKWFIK